MADIQDPNTDSQGTATAPPAPPLAAAATPDANGRDSEAAAAEPEAPANAAADDQPGQNDGAQDAASGDSDARAALAENLRRQIEERKAALAARRETKAARDAENAALQEEAEDVRKAVRERQEALAGLQKEESALQRQRDELQPAYERALENRELRERHDALRREVAAEEAALKENEGEARRLEAQLEEVSAAFKREREAKERLQRTAANHLAALRAAVSAKLGLILPIDDVESEHFISPDDLIEASETLFRQRGVELSNNVRVCRELEAIVAMKHDALEALEAQAAGELRGAREDRDDAIRELVWQMQEERNNLHADIEEIRKINSEQAVNLKRGHVEKHTDPMRFRRQPATRPPGTPRAGGGGAGGTGGSALVAPDPHARRSTFRKAAPMTQEMRLLVAKNKELEAELADIKARINRAVAERTEVLKQTKALEARIRRDGKTFETELARIEAEIAACEYKVGLLDRENSRMTDAVAHLGGLVKTTKEHVEHVRGRTEPLPLE